MNILLKVKENKWLVGAFVFAIANLAAIFSVFGFRKYGDTQGYIKAICWFRDAGCQIEPLRFLRPLGPMLATRFEFLGAGAGLIVQNIIFYFLLVFLLFKIIDLVFDNKEYAFLASLFFITSTPFIDTGLTYLTDTGSWFFYCFSIYLTLLYFRFGKEKLIPLNGFLSGLGVLLKENAGLGAPFFVLMVLFAKNISFKNKIVKIAIFSAIFLAIIIGWQFLCFKLFHYTFFDVFFGPAKPAAVGESVLVVALRYLGQLFRTMGLLWPFIFLGIFQVWRKKDWGKTKIFLALLPASFSFLAWSPDAGARTTFLFAPLGILLSISGLSFLEEKLSKQGFALMVFFLIAAIILANYFFCWFNPKVSFVDIIARFLGIR